MNYQVEIKNNDNAGEISISFDSSISDYRFYLFQVVNNTPELLIESTAKKIKDNIISFQELKPSRYIVKAVHKTCESIVIGGKEGILLNSTKN
jgi:hypothetical protein